MNEAPRGRGARSRAEPGGQRPAGRRVAPRSTGSRPRVPGGRRAVPRIQLWDHAESSPAAIDGRLLQVVKERRVTSIPEVIEVMDRIDRCLPERDGLKWFNLLYKTVTERIARDIDAGFWQAPRWLIRLDVVFAELYFDAIERYLQDAESAPRVWCALFDRRWNVGIARVQYCMAGVSAHINRDLPVAIVQAWEAEGTTDYGLRSPEYHDYNRVSELLEEVELAVMKQLATGFFKAMGELFGSIEDWAVMQIVRRARLLAWINAIHLRQVGLTTDEGRRYIQGIDDFAARYGRLMLAPTE
jgi:hypothetical protein